MRKVRHMSATYRAGIAATFAESIARGLGLLVGSLGAVLRYARERKAARQAQRDSRCSEQKLTDELERRLMQRFSRNRSFRL